MYPQGYVCLSEGVHLRVAEDEKNIFTYYLFPNIYTYITEYYFQKSLQGICLLLNMSMNEHDNIFCHRKF